MDVGRPNTDPPAAARDEGPVCSPACSSRFYLKSSIIQSSDEISQTVKR